MSTTEKAQRESVRSAPPGPIKAKQRLGDRVFSGTALGAGVIILIVLAAVATFLIIQSVPAFEPDTSGNHILNGESFWTYVWPLVFGTLWASFIALLVAAPISIGIALFISHYAPRKLAAALGYIIDLLAAVPSVVFGLWGGLVLAPLLQPLYAWLNAHAAWIPFFGGQVSPTGRTILTASLVLAVMIIPIMTAICREVFLQTPTLHEEAALALGATRWEMVRMAVLPFARGGMISAAMLALGRALGETMAVATVLSPSFLINVSLLNPGGGTFAQNIAAGFKEAGDLGRDALIASGLVLFVITLLVNGAARLIIARRKEYSGANA